MRWRPAAGDPGLGCLACSSSPALGWSPICSLAGTGKAFAKQSKLLRQDVEASAKPFLARSCRGKAPRFPAWTRKPWTSQADDAGAAQFPFSADRAQHGRDPAERRDPISVDSEVCSIGSANIDIRSFSINYELNAVLYSRKLATELEEAFERDLADCTEFDPAECEARNVALRFRDFVARLLSPLL